MIDTSWSQLLHTPMGEFVSGLMDNPILHYHNIQHPMRLYALANAWRLRYDVNLDAGILWHDAIYDNQPLKEYRSAMAMRAAAELHPEWFLGIDVDEVFNLIMSTADHVVQEGTNRLLIKLDLAELGDPVRRRANFWSIIEESCALYGITQREAAASTEKFMQSFLLIVMNNHVHDMFSTLFHYDGDAYWNGVVEGVREVITMAVTVQEACDRIQLT